MGLRVRKVRTASGATAVQIVLNRHGTRTIVEHVGSAHTDAELAVLIQTAWDRIHQQSQQAFDLDGLEPSAPAAPVTVVGSSSRVLWEILEQAYAALGFDAVGDDVFKKLVLGRVVEPVSKADTLRVLGELGVTPPSLRTVWRVLARCVAGDWRDALAKAAYPCRALTGGVGLVQYDVTTLYFEAEREDELRKVGYSKERRVYPQIVVWLLVDSEGFPLEIHMFDGKKPEAHTLIPVLAAFRERHRVTDLVVVADAGMLSDANLSALEDAGFGFIVGSRTAKAPKDLAGHFNTHGKVFQHGQIIETTTAMGRGGSHFRRVVYQFSKKRWVRDNQTLDLQRERAERIVSGESRPKKARFVKQGVGEAASLDEGAVWRARELAGLKGYVTNMTIELLDGAGVVAAYHDLFQVERSFRMAKTDLRARPMFHHREESIEAHLTIVFAALAVSRYLQEVGGVSIRQVVKLLRPLRDVTVRVRGENITAVTPAEGAAADLLRRLGEVAQR